MSEKQYHLPKARTNHGIFNIRFQCPSVRNSIDEDTKSSSSSLFKKKVKQCFIKDYYRTSWIQSVCTHVSNSCTNLLKQHGRRLIVLEHQYGCHDVMCIRSLNTVLKCLNFSPLGINLPCLFLLCVRVFVCSFVCRHICILDQNK